MFFLASQGFDSPFWAIAISFMYVSYSKLHNQVGLFQSNRYLSPSSSIHKWIYSFLKLPEKPVTKDRKPQNYTLSISNRSSPQKTFGGFIIKKKKMLRLENWPSEFAIKILPWVCTVETPSIFTPSSQS